MIKRTRSRVGPRSARPATLAVLVVISAGLAPVAPRGAAEEAKLDVIVARGVGSRPAAEAAVARHGGVVTGRLDIVHGFTATVPASRLSAIADEPAVGDVSVDRPVDVQGDVDGGTAVRSVHRDATGASDLHRAGITGRGVTVALIDTGVADVADLDGRVLDVTDPLTGAASACVDLSGEGSCDDTYGHGTFMAGLILGDGAASGGRFAGTAPGADLISIKVAGRDGSSDVSKVLAGIQWAVANRDRYGIRVLNLSLGTDSTQSWEVDPFNYAVERAWDAGIFVTVSASNLGPAPGTIAKPGDDPWVLTVGAVDDRGTPPPADDRLPDFSSRGPTVDGLAKPDVVAPGAHVVSLTAPGSAIEERFPSDVDASYRRGSGTSMAAAVVSGGVALLLEQHPDWAPDQVKEALRSTAQPTASSDVMAVGAGGVDLVGAAGARAAVPAQALERSSGLGSLDASRGNVRVRTHGLLGTVLSGSLTAQMLLWDPVGFTTGDWSAGTVRTSPLLLHRWYGTSWSGDDWQGNNWQGNNWQGNNWQGNNWQGDWAGATEDGDARPADTYGLPWLGAAWFGLWE